MVTFTYLATVLTLPSPELKDVEKLNLRSQIDRSMNGTIRAYKGSPPFKQFKLNFAHVNRPKVLEVISFLKASAGQPVSYTDYNNMTFKVVILDDPFEATHTAVRNNTFEFLLEVIP